MGKAALFVVFGFSLAGATLLYTTRQADVQTSSHQSEYDADVIAREIARSAYNAAIADINRGGRNRTAAARAIGTLVVSATVPEAQKCKNERPECYRRTGQMQGGRFVVESSINGGNGIDVYAAGYYAYSTVDANGRRTRAEKEHTVNEYHPVGVLEVAPSGSGGKLRIQFVDSQAGYCSAIFLQRLLPGVAEDRQPGVQMVYAPGHNRNGDRNYGYEVELAPGTQMNFGVGVDMNCGSGGSRPTSRADLRKQAASTLLSQQGPDALAALMAGYRYLESDWNHVHWALDADALEAGRTEEGPWAMVEVDPTNNQRWRIAFEDIHDWNVPATNPHYNNPNRSLAALKRFGYDWTGNFRTVASDGVGNGWTDVVRTVITPSRDSQGRETGRYTISEASGQDGFHDLRDGDLDMSDQVIMVEVIPPTTTTASL